MVVKDWLRFWSAASWRSWWGRRRAWKAYRAEADELDRAIALLDARHTAVRPELRVELDELRVKRAALVAPPRPVSPAWVPTIGVLVLLSIAGSPPAESSPTAIEATTTTTELTTTTASPTTTFASTTTTTSPVTTTTLPPVPQAEVIFAAPIAGSSGDPGAPFPSQAEVVTVVSITDGDTVDVELANGTVEPLRLIGINSPESGECWADEAALALSALAPVGTQAGITVDTSDRDRFNRILRYLWVGGMSVNQELVRRGAAISRHYPPDTSMAGVLDEAQVEAQQAHLGVWAPDACGPAADADLRITNLVYNPPGDESQNLNEEYIQILNFGDNLVNMTGWGIKDESASNRYSFPAGFTLGPDETVTVHSGCGDDFDVTLFWCSTGSAIWNNDGDTAFLTDASGNTHTISEYSPPTTTTQAPTTTTREAATTTDAGAAGCHPSYQGECVPVGVSDVDCIGGSGNGPYYVGRVTVVGPDEYDLDRDNDGVGCES